MTSYTDSACNIAYVIWNVKKIDPSKIKSYLNLYFDVWYGVTFLELFFSKLFFFWRSILSNSENFIRYYVCVTKAYTITDSLFSSSKTYCFLIYQFIAFTITTAFIVAHPDFLFPIKFSPSSQNLLNAPNNLCKNKIEKKKIRLLNPNCQY